MKRIAILLLCAASLCACSIMSFDDDIRLQKRQNIILSKSQMKLIESGNSFAFNMLKTLLPKEEEQEVFISPFSLQVAFSMLSNGAGGDTHKQIAATLGFEGYSAEDLNDTYNTLLPALFGADNSTKLHIANAMWYRPDFPVKSSFSQTLRNSYGATVDPLDFSSPQALETVNSWAKDNTNGMIPEILDRTDPDWVYLLANALYFKGTWTTKFDVEKTKKEDFYCIDGKKVSMDFLHGEIPCKFAYDENLSAALCELPFGNKAFVLDILLPDNGIDFNKFVANLSDKEWDAITSNLREIEEEYVIIPKFDFTYSGDKTILETLKELGIVDAFGGKADFSGISESATYVSDVIHKARIKMDEKGAEAAAVTVIGAKEYAAPLNEFFADHPFVFAIRETSTKAILFLGTFRGI